MADNVGSKVTYFLVGLGVGALVGVLFAPKSGEETREYLSKRADDGRDFAQNKARELRERADELIERSKEVAVRKQDSISRGCGSRPRSVSAGIEVLSSRGSSRVRLSLRWRIGRGVNECNSGWNSLASLPRLRWSCRSACLIALFLQLKKTTESINSGGRSAHADGPDSDPDAIVPRRHPAEFRQPGGRRFARSCIWRAGKRRRWTVFSPKLRTGCADNWCARTAF